MAKKYYSDKDMGSMPKSNSGSSVFPMDNKVTSAGEMPVGSTPSYDTGMAYSDEQARKNSAYKKNTKN